MATERLSMRQTREVLRQVRSAPARLFPQTSGRLRSERRPTGTHGTLNVSSSVRPISTEGVNGGPSGRRMDVEAAEPNASIESCGGRVDGTSRRECVGDQSSDPASAEGKGIEAAVMR